MLQVGFCEDAVCQSNTATAGGNQARIHSQLPLLLRVCQFDGFQRAVYTSAGGLGRVTDTASTSSTSGTSFWFTWDMFPQKLSGKNPRETS